MTPAALIARAAEARRDGRALESAEIYGQAVGALREVDDPDLLVHALRHQGEILSIAGRHGAAEPLLAEALSVARTIAGISVLDLANTVRPLGILRAAIGHDSARGLLTEARGLYAEAGIGDGVLEMDRRLAALG